MKLLEKINNVNEECSDFYETEDNMERDDDLFTTDELESPDRNNEKKNIINKRRGQNRRRLLLNFESESDVKHQHIEIASNGTVLRRNWRRFLEKY